VKKIKKIIQTIMSAGPVRRLHRRLSLVFLSVLSSHRIIASVYFILTPWGFNRERYALLKGRAQYYNNLSKVKANNSHLRRNVHRLEKALIMEPRRSSFAQNYIEETIEYYEAVAVVLQQNPSIVDLSEMRWASDVISNYFEVVDKTGSIGPLLRRFEDARNRVAAILGEDDDTARHTPFKRKESPDCPVSYEQMLQLSMRRRSVRWFKDKKVPRELIDKAMLIGRQSPSACNRQPFEYMFFDDPEMVKKVASIPFGAGGYSHNIKTIAVLVGKQEYFFSGRDRHVIYIDSALSAMAFMFGLETVGLASSVINWPDFEPLEAKMQKTLGLSADDRVIMLIAVGYARDDGGIPFSEKKALESIRSFNRVSSAN
jgi:nitroreductase